MLLWDNGEKWCTAGQATEDDVIERMHFVCCTANATDTHSESVILMAFQRQKCLRKRF
jgi:hypothetical protein